MVNTTNSAILALLNTEKLVAKYMGKDAPVPSSGLMGAAKPKELGDKRLLTAQETVAKAVADIRKMRQGLKNG
jgi:hypothetical protein|tara:strand:+ start:711 stop:929 length:219 start_codon:yes stop_codon:yes gene_type:complete